MNKKEKLLITGASGFTGYHACQHFSKLDFDITAIAHKNDFYDERINWRKCDFSDKEAVKALIKKIKPDYVLHLAGQNAVSCSWEDPIRSLEVNSMATAYLLEALRLESPTCKTVIVGSALQFDPTSISTFNHPYGLSKTMQFIISQFWANLYNMHIVVAKPSNLIGPGFSKGVCSIFAQKIVQMEKKKEEKKIEVSNLNNRIDFLDVRDAVRAYDFLFLKGKSGKVYEVSSGKSHSLGQVLKIFREMTAINFHIEVLQENHLSNHINTIPLSLIELGWEPTYSIESTLKDVLHFYRKSMD